MPRKKTALAALALAALVAAPRAASAWEVSFTPYLWLPSVDGTVGAGTDSTLPPVEFNAFSENLKLGGAMVNLTWQGYAVGGYGLSWGDLVAGWRHLYVDKGEGSTRLRLTLSGPLVGAHFTF
jgi:hypothetical protein